MLSKCTESTKAVQFPSTCIDNERSQTFHFTKKDFLKDGQEFITIERGTAKGPENINS